jgi:dCMP deaminase
VIVAKDERISATGYNGPAKTFSSNGPDCTHWCSRGAGTSGPATGNYDACPSIHAEINALLYVDRSRVEGGTMYLTTPPCMDCGKAISNSGLSRVVTMIRAVDARRDPELVFDYLRGCGIEVTVLPVNEKD